MFGIVGGEAQALRLDDAPGLSFVLTRHEFAAGVMADVASRLTGEIHAALSTFGPGLTNLSTGACSAMLDRSPALFLAAQVPRREACFNRTHQCIDNVGLMKTLTKHAGQLESAQEIPTVLGAAGQAALAECPGPAFISLPLDLMATPIGDREAAAILAEVVPPRRLLPPPPDPAALHTVASRIASAERPLIVVGNQVIRVGAVAALRRFAEALNIPVVASLAGKGILPDSHPLSLGALNKYVDRILGHDVLAELGSADLIVLVGYDYGEDLKPDLFPLGVDTVGIDEVPMDMGALFQPTYQVSGALVKTLDDLAARPIAPRADVPAWQALRRRRPVAPPGTTDMGETILALRRALGPSGILCSDIGLHKQYAGLLSATEAENTFLCSNGCGTFGFGLPAAMAAKIVCPERAVVAICGDGGFHSTSHDLETLTRLGLTVVIVVLVDHAFGLIEHYQLRGHGQTIPHAVRFAPVDFVGLARANGVRALRVDRPAALAAAVTAGLQDRGPTLIEMPVTYDQRP